MEARKRKEKEKKEKKTKAEDNMAYLYIPLRRNQQQNRKIGYTFENELTEKQKDITEQKMFCTFLGICR